MSKQHSITWSHFLKENEINIILKYLPKNSLKILEIGGGDGYQANMLSKLNYDVTSIDLNPKTPQFFNVKKIYSTKLDFPNESFDIIFSSNVIPHIKDLESIFSETKRILKKDGLIIHIVPSTWWSIQTNFWHYIFIPIYLKKSLFKRFRSTNKKNESQKSKTDLKQIDQSIESKFKQLFFHPLGEHTSFIHEIYNFSKYFWKKLFLKNDFKIVAVVHGPYVASGYGVFKMKFINIRKLLNIFFPSYYCIILKN